MLDAETQSASSAEAKLNRKSNRAVNKQPLMQLTHVISICMQDFALSEVVVPR